MSWLNFEKPRPWAAWCKDVLATDRHRTPRDERPAAVAEYWAAGMSERTMAAAMSTGRKQIKEAKEQLVSKSPASSNEEVPTQVMGLDGKLHPARMPKRTVYTATRSNDQASENFQVAA